MSDHAVIFYVPERKGYALCYEEDLEELPEAVIDKKQYPYFRPFVRIGRVTRYKQTYQMLIQYVKEDTKQIIQKVVCISPTWINRMVSQFDLTFPGGLPDNLVAEYGLSPLADKTTYEQRKQRIFEAANKKRTKKIKGRTKGVSRCLYE